MRHYVYIMGNESKKGLHVGVSANPGLAVAMYEALPTLRMPPYKPFLLYYLEELIDKEAATKRMDEIVKLDHWDKTALIQQYNPEWAELKIGINIEL